VGTAVEGFRQALLNDYRWTQDPPPPPPAGNNAAVSRTQSTVPASILSGQSQEVVIKVQNTGGTTWSAGANYRLGATASNQFSFEGFPCGGYSVSPTNSRVYLCDDVAPGEWYEFRFRIRPLAGASGAQAFSLRMVRDGVEWFGNTETWNITIQAPPPAQLIQNGDFSSGLTGWTVWNERGSGNASIVNGELRLSGDFNGGVYQQFQTGGAGAVVKVNGFWVGEATAAARWAEVLIINGSRLPVAGQDVHSGQSDVVLLYKNDRSPGWSGQMSDTAPVASLGSFTASGSVATILLKAGSWGGAAVTRYDNLTVERNGLPPGPNLPDVVVESIALTPASPRAGDAVSFSALVKNIGSGPTPNGVTLGVGYTVLQGKTVAHQTWGAVAGPLAAGASVTAGDFVVEAKVDDVNRFEESNENNNLRSLPFTVADAAPPVLRVGRIGFHVGPGGNQTGLGDWMRRLDAAGIPFFLKSADSAG
jgi:hypothetical protein